MLIGCWGYHIIHKQTAMEMDNILEDVSCWLTSFKYQSKRYIQYNAKMHHRSSGVTFTDSSSELAEILVGYYYMCDSLAFILFQSASLL